MFYYFHCYVSLPGCKWYIGGILPANSGTFFATYIHLFMGTRNNHWCLLDITLFV